MEHSSITQITKDVYFWRLQLLLSLIGLLDFQKYNSNDFNVQHSFLQIITDAN